MSTTTQHGYLLLGDISGYTSFVAETELDHSYAILSDLLETIYTRIEKLMTIQSLEGDAVFAYPPERRAARDLTILVGSDVKLIHRLAKHHVTRATGRRASLMGTDKNGKKTLSETVRLEPLPEGGTHVTQRARLYLSLPRWLRRLVARRLLLHPAKYDQLIADAARLAGESYNRALQAA